MKATLWGTRGSLASPGPDTARYGGNTSCVQVHDHERMLILDAGSGLRRLGMVVPTSHRRVDILLTHLHLDHILGLGFFGPLFNPAFEVHIWGPGSTTLRLEARLMRHLSPPFFPLHLHELSQSLTLHEIARSEFDIGEFHVESALICHPGPTLGFRITHSDGSVLTYLPDHEPALGVGDFPLSPEWTSGYDLATGAGLLIHDTQYDSDEYLTHEGWGHSSVEQAMRFARLAEVRQMVPFHYDPAHSDEDLDRMMMAAIDTVQPRFRVTPGMEGLTYEVMR